MIGPQKTKAAGLDTRAALENTQQPNYVPLADLVQANIDGQRAASNAVASLTTHYADPDALYGALRPLLPETRDIEAMTKVRAFLRVLQKRIERGQA